MSDINKLKDLYEQYRKIKGYNNGGVVQHYDTVGEVIDPGLVAFMQQNPKLDPTIAAIAYRNKGSMPPSPTPPAPVYQNPNPYQNFAEKAAAGIPAFAEGGEVQDESSQNLTPEQFEAHLQDLKNQGMHLNNVSGDEQNIIGGNPVPEASTEEPQDPEDKELENSLANEDFAAGEDSDKGDGKLQPMPAEEDGTEVASNEAPKEPLADEAAGLETSDALKNELDKTQNPEQSSVERLLAAIKPQAGMSLADAQKQRDRNIAANQIGQAGVMIGAGLSRTDPSQQLAQLKDNEKFINMPIQKYDEIIANQKNDPNSNFSKTYGAAAAEILGIDPKKFEGVPATTIDKIVPLGVKKQANIIATQKFLQTVKHQTAMETHQKNIEDIERERLAQEKELKEQNKSNKANTDQDRALTTAQTLLESSRGQPAVQQAEKDLYATQKVKSLMDNYKNLDNMPQAQVNLLINEVSKIATGGVPTGHETEGLKPGTPASGLATLWGKVQNKPTGANVGAYINELDKYLKPLSTDAQQLIQDRYHRILEPRKKMLGEDNFNQLKTHYLDRFNQSQTQSKGSVSKGQLTAYSKAHNIDENSARDLLTKGGYQVE